MSGEEARMGDGGCGGNAAPYVLGALTEAEHDAFVRHLSTCSVCREEVAALQSVTAALPSAAPQLPAPPELKRRLMAEVKQDQRRQRSARPSAATPRRRRLALPASALGALAAAAAVVVVLALVLLGGGGGARVVHARLSVPGASAEVRVSGGRAELTLAGMPQVRPGRVYQVWVKRSGVPQPTDALFTVSDAGAATVAVPGSIAGVRAVLVTSEPLGGSRAPTTAPVLIARLD
jgi:anti-sigma-K factor RskA